MRTITVPVEGLNFAGCAQSIEKRLSALPPITRVDASYVTQTATIEYDDTQLTENDVRALVRDCGFACGAPMETLEAMVAARQAPQPVAAAPHARHAAPETVAQREERAGHVGHEMAPREPMSHAHAGAATEEPRATAHGAHGAHDMSDPLMAQAMEAVLRARFFVALALTVPIIFYSALGVDVLRIRSPDPTWR